MNIFASNKPYCVFYLIFIVIISIMMSMYSFPEALDIGRYYEDAENYSKIYTLSQYFDYLVNNNIDFIYTSLLYIFAKIGLSLNLLTVFFISLYYISMCEAIRVEERVTVPGVVLLMILLYCPFVWIQAISRNTAAIAIFYYSILNFISNRKIVGVLLCIVSCFTHISMCAWILLAIAALIIKKLNISRWTIIIIYVAIIVFALIVPSYMIDIFSLIVSTSESRYSSYGSLGMVSPLLSEDFGYGDKLPMLFDLIFSIYLVLVSKKHDFFFYMLFLLSSCLVFAILTSTMFTNRIIMLLPLFVGCNICTIFKSDSQSKRLQIYYFSLIGLGCNFLHFWSYRNELFF